MDVIRIITKTLRPLSIPGLIFALLFFGLSLTPTLMPRSYLVQGALSGACAAVGYMIGVGLAWLWRYLEIPQPVPRRLGLFLIAFTAVASFVALWHAVEWQNSIRALWHMPRMETFAPFSLGVIAIATFLVALAAGRLFRMAYLSFSTRLNRVVPRRVSNVFGAMLAALLFWSVGEGVLLRFALNTIDTSFREIDALIDDNVPPPSQAEKTGSSASHVNWQGLGRQGRNFVSAGPSSEDIGDFWKKPATEPVRVYVGLNNAETAEERASLALQELQRQNAFDRSLLVVIAPTGTGWVDPAAIDTLEYLHEGDVASVALQYSYLSSWLSLLVEPEEGKEAAAALFEAVYRYWTTLPEDGRPRLYLHGLSLGALNSQLSTDIYSILGDPFQGALWSGPPFRTERWKSVTRQRNPGTPQWLPQFRDGSVIRFANQNGFPDREPAPWGPIRFIYLQYASDPVVFFEPEAAIREPEWMDAPRGPDVSPELTWIPVVTMLQLLFDMMIATTSPIGYGHIYAPQHYIDCWIALTDPQVEGAEIEDLKALFNIRFRDAS